MMAAGVLAPNMCQATSNHHDNSSMVKEYHSGTCIVMHHIMLYTCSIMTIKQTMLKGGQVVNLFVVGGLIFSQW